ncbi:putative 3-methyladenine DNA glycosylase [Streptomyces sp. RB5]|uniref:Putative 3-methyladenine DNA glycosylase n=1 Tax=Streptomyces smaragdinus TaxID=2585196 RepID=A0A7K0CTU8_9ACTN|nr:DNA-3-methyladenine glycosylase [Streptomyces smaragdinus]MQY16899.1 putative 3-methyladenine DNA glycosylase [Streptomyces smaragdinus]
MGNDPTPPDLDALLPRAFYARPAHVVAPELLGRILVSGTGDATVALRITEVEAYEGETDPASHGWRGRTPRNATMFGPAGHLYVYWIYGMHHAANVVCGTEGVSHGVLVRAGEIVTGHAEATDRRPAARSPKELAQGPGRLADALGITRALDGTDVCDAHAPIRLAAGEPVRRGRVRHGPRTGVSRAHDTPWRYWIADDPTVSRYRRHTPRKRSPKPGDPE